MEAKLKKKKKKKEEITLSKLRIGHTRITHSYLLKRKQQPMCYACQTKYTVKNILIECTDLDHIRKTFYSTNNMKELFQNTEINNVISFLKTVKLYTKILRNLQSDQITSINPFFTRYILTNWSLPQPVSQGFFFLFMIMIPYK